MRLRLLAAKILDVLQKESDLLQSIAGTSESKI